LSPGTTFGEFALTYTGRQLTTIRAIDDVEVLVLSAQKIASIEKSNPQLAIRLSTAIAREAYTVLEQSSREAGAREEYGPDQYDEFNALGPLPTGSGPDVWVMAYAVLGCQPVNNAIQCR